MPTPQRITLLLALTLTTLITTPPILAKDKFVVTWKSDPTTTSTTSTTNRPDPSPKLTAIRMADLMSRVLQTKINAVPWERAQADTLFLITQTKHVSPTIAAPLQNKARDAFSIQYPINIDNRNVCLLLSRDAKAYAFPMYHFLQKFMGVNFVGPGPLGEVIPQNPNWSIPRSINIIQNPHYEHRALSISADMDAQAWGLNGSRMGFHHNMGNVYDPKKYSHIPELYPFYNNTRNIGDPNFKNGRAGWQPCITHPDAVNLAANFGLNELKQNPNQLTFGLSVNDGLGYCLCAFCLAADPASTWDHGNPWLTDRYIQYYNQVLQKMLTQNPNARIAFLGYNRLKTPPLQTKGDPRLIVFNCVDNTNPIPNMVTRQKAWAATGITPSLYMRFNDVGFLTVRHYPNAMADLLKTTHQLGGQGFYTETVQNWAASGPRLYALAHSLWNTNTDIKQIQNQYMHLAFGPNAAPFMTHYFNRWEQLWERDHPDERYNTTRNNSDFTQMNHLTRDDVQTFDQAIAQAQAAQATPLQKQRLHYVATYYQWLRINADQWLLAQEFKNNNYLANQTNESILTQAACGLTLTKTFNNMTQNTILPDKTGWLWSARAKNQERVIYEDFNGKLRQSIVALFKSSIDDAFNHITSRLLKTKSKSHTIEYWQTQAQNFPKLSPYALTQANLIQHSPGPNLIPNGNFESGHSNPASINNWNLGGLRWQGMPPTFKWQNSTGQNNSAAIAAGIGRMGIISAKPPIDPNKRYQFSFYYKTTKNLNPTVRLFIKGLPPWRIPIPLAPAAEKWIPFSMTFSGKDIIANNNLGKNTALVDRIATAQQAFGKAEKNLAKMLDQPQTADPTRLANRRANLENTRKQLAQFQATQTRNAKKSSSTPRMDLQFQIMTLDKDQWIWIDNVQLTTILN